MKLRHLAVLFAVPWLIASAFAADTEIKNPSVNGGINDGKLRLVIEGPLDGKPGDHEKQIFSTAIDQSVKVTRDKITSQFTVAIEIFQGEPKELSLTISGEGEIKQVTGDALQDWGIRQGADGVRQLILRPKKGDQPLTKLSVTVTTVQELKGGKSPLNVLTLIPPQPDLFHGFVKVESVPELDVQPVAPTGLLPVEAKYLPQMGAANPPVKPGKLPYAKPVPGKPGFYLSPYEPGKGLIDMRGFTPGTEVKDPYTGKSFLVPGNDPEETAPTDAKTDEPEPLGFQFHGSAYTLPLKITVVDPEARQVVLRDFKLAGLLNPQSAAFVLSATAHVANPKGGSLALLSGQVALTELPQHNDWRIVLSHGRYSLVFDKPGDYPVQFKFGASVTQDGGWNSVDFKIAPSALQSIRLQGLPADTQFRFDGAARPERNGSEFSSFLPPNGAVKLSWKTATPETEGKLFYSAEMLSQISLAPGLMQQAAVLDCKVMQGELDHLTLLLHGDGEVTRVQGDAVLAWNIEPGANAGDRRLVVRFNEAQKNQFKLLVQTQTPLGAFPQTTEAMQLLPEGATRFAGYFRIVNEGAVRLEVAQARGLSQVSPEQFPETDETKEAFRAGGAQRFVYRFSGADFALRIQADQILPEVTVSELFAYHLGETEQSIDSEIELDIREAPLRELLLRIPKGYAVAKLVVAGLSDYFVHDLDGAAELRLVYAQPVSGRQVVQLRLERNGALGAADWELPRIDVEKAKSVRGNLAVSADAGFRLTATRTQSLTEIATAFFPRKVLGIQSAFRLSDAAWQATLHIERLPQSIQVDAMHLFSIGEGVAYGSSVLNYMISGSPVSAFRVELSDEYFNVEFTGKDIRSWQKTDGGYLVQLHTPVAGAYTLLATYERPFKAQGETLTFTGARPLDAQSEQGHTLVISAYQFQVKPVDVSASLLPLETGEVPAEYRLFFDAPILAAYRYTARPFNLKLALSPLAQGDSLSQVVDRAALSTRISKEGQVLTDVHYFVKNRGNGNLRLTLPEGTELWSATVNGAAVVPVKDNQTDLLPLPQQADPNAVLAVDLKLASRAKDPEHVTVTTPSIGAPVMLAEWKLEPDTAQRLVYRHGSLTPVNAAIDISGFAQLARILGGSEGAQAISVLIAALVLLALSVWIWRGAAREGVYKDTTRHLAALVLGCIAFILSSLVLLRFGEIASEDTATLPRSLTFLAPVQQAGNALSVEVDNLEQRVSALDFISTAWPALFAIAAFVLARRTGKSSLALLGWVLLAWAVLRCPNGAFGFLAVLAAFFIFQLAVPALRRLWQAPLKPRPVIPPNGGLAAATAVLLLALLIHGVSAQDSAPLPPKETPVAETVTQQIRVEEKFALATARIHWQAIQGQRLPLLYEPAVLTKATYPAKALKLVQFNVGAKRTQQLLALESGTFDIDVQYQVPVTKQDDETGFALPTQFGLVNQLTLTLTNLDVDVVSPQAVSIDRKNAGKDTIAQIALTPVNESWIAWKPRSRDVTQEKAVFYAELTQLYAPTAGVIEGLHSALIRPAQGELSELVFSVPKGATITNVVDPATLAPDKDPAASMISQWRFDPDTGKLRVNLNPPQSGPFTLLIYSQIATGPLPVAQEVGLVSVDGSAGQIGLLGVATGNDVQLDDVTAATLVPINLEDFPGNIVPILAPQMPGLAVRRAFRYSDPKITATVKASAVEPDVRVETQDTLSLGEDRVLLATEATVNITRAGIFRLSFALPAGLDVDSVSGQSLSHWTELKTDTGRIITMHLHGRTEGQQQFSISLTGPGMKSAKAWAAPQLLIREASKQRGTYLVVPEQGMRPQVTKRDGLTQLDPQKSGIKQKGVLAFRVLQTPWNLELDLEQVDPWVQVTSLQHATLGEAQVKVTANLQYQIENAGLKTFHLALPTNAENVRFTGDQLSDFLLVPNSEKEGLQSWEVKLHRKVIGQYFLQVTYQTAVAANAAQTDLRGVQVADVNLQRGFVTVQAGGRLQVRVDTLPAALQPVEWQSIPRALQQGLTASSASFAYRLVEPAFTLPMKLERHEAAKLLPARVNDITFTSVISDTGAMLTQARLDILPGDKRLLHLTLPKEAKFWFAFVNQNGVWPWREGDQILIPLEQQSHGGKPVPVEVFFSSQVGEAGTHALDLQLLAPKFDLPLENIVWRVYLNEKWKLKKWTGSLQLQGDEIAAHAATVDVQSYLQSEETQLRDKTRAAEQMLNFGNSALAQGNPQEARRAFESAFGLSQHDNAFNEDARVQLHNLKLQQAIVGLNVRQSSVAGEPDVLAGKLRSGHGGKEANYTQQDARQILDSNTADDNAAFNRLAERIIQQQDAAVNTPAAIQANIPEQGRLLTFSRAVAVDPWADLQVEIQAKAAATVSWFTRFLILLGTLVILALFSRGAGVFRQKPAA
ncbi:hypothetical protein CfE428DRAFT_2824 [Chthoniobacter flavus Ellin428]|uniref:Alpha-2-macroglobulin domain protein n=1 Tax=Chthoniobacter flavus Ellin428 TaxID=497964 RepID=B4D1N6_9BACT|nr:hypothetical protein [Chthoniobacter flavus]EDY19648.1 hypothetical protein CfE428DRAFT_2824 [Chthoniobacter flavus Ellin428]TCO92885.1 hypothetical protein EV701_105162 [Chthoniobacter flavus]